VVDPKGLKRITSMEYFSFGDCCFASWPRKTKEAELECQSL